MFSIGFVRFTLKCSRCVLILRSPDNSKALYKCCFSEAQREHVKAQVLSGAAVPAVFTSVAVPRGNERRLISAEADTSDCPLSRIPRCLHLSALAPQLGTETTLWTLIGPQNTNHILNQSGAKNRDSINPTESQKKSNRYQIKFNRFNTETKLNWKYPNLL